MLAQAEVVGDWGPLVVLVLGSAGFIPLFVRYQRTIVDSSLRRVTDLEKRQNELELEQRREREWCDARINQLVFTLHQNGIEVPPPPPREH